LISSVFCELSDVQHCFAFIFDCSDLDVLGFIKRAIVIQNIFFKMAFSNPGNHSEGISLMEMKQLTAQLSLSVY
jgi:hypothetical protein